MFGQYKKVGFIAAGLCLVGSGWTEAPLPDYETQIAPIFETHCYECHGPDARKGGLRLSNEIEARHGGDAGHSPLKADSEGTVELLRRITSHDEAVQMPPKGDRLPEATIALLEAWIAGGAPWNGDSSDASAPAAPTFWSFKAPVQSTPAEHSDLNWGRNAIDAFVLDSILSHKLTPSPEADRHTLIRRLSLDLRGLPPTPEEVRDFVADTRPNAYEALVERFLASPHYGERQAIGWLDVARYADTNGYEKDRPRSIWPYRDWVIDAFNADMPFDRFVIEQIAGDMLPSPTREQRIATGFHRNVMLNEEGGIDVEEFRFNNVVDRTNTTATALLGLTFACAQCHTHKYDPISQREYYQLYAFFNNTDDVTIEVPDPEITERQQAHDAKIDALRAGLYDAFPPGDTRPVTATLQPEAARSAQGESLPTTEDGVVHVQAADAEKNTYIAQVTLPSGRVDGIVLNVLTGETGPGRTPHGNFVLSEFVGYQLDGDTRTSLVFGKAEADFSQDDYPVAYAVDGNIGTGWAVGADPAGVKRDRQAKFYFKEPLNLDAPQTVEIHLEQQFGNQHTLGDFSLEALTLQIPDSSIPENERRERFFAEQFAAWSAETKATCQDWRPLSPLEMSAKKLTTLERLPDDSILARGDIPNNDIYELKLRTDARNITGIRLEALPHESLPGGGPGRGVILSEGDFLLTGIKISAAPWDNPEAAVPVAIRGATESFANGDKTAAKSLDGKADTGWSIHGGEGKAHAAVYTLETPLDFTGGTVFFVTLEQKYIHQHTLGHFRLSVTDGPDPEASGLPAEIETALLASPRSEDDQDQLEAYFLAHTPLLAKEHDAIAALEASRPQQPTTLALVERERVRSSHLHHRGEFMSERAAVQPDVPEVLPPLPQFAPRNRLTLAKWLVNEDNPLTARVTMNRLWQQLFGRGIVRTTEDFGIMGEAPTHPELLDWLAVEFMRRGWSMKEMVRLIVCSSTYRQSAAISPEAKQLDPENIYLARAPRFRVAAELVRDIALASSGSLDESIGGPSVFPPLPDGLLQFVYGGFSWNTDEGPARHRRGMYTYWKRMLPYPTAAVFDAPARDMVCVRRLRTNTPMQALTLLNDEVFMEASRTLADSVLKESPDDPQARLTALFMRCLAREPDATEADALLAYLDAQKALLAAQSPEVLRALTQGDENTPHEAQVERALWTLLSRAVLNLDETITRG